MKKKHRDNLLKLADYLDALPDDYEQFDMSEYMMERDDQHPAYWGTLSIEERSKPVCGTVACAVGHGPSAGIRVYGDECWGSYADRVFGFLPDDGFDYMFASGWSVDDNTPKGAAARIRTYVTLGHSPDDWSYEDPKVLV
jgi:hypothetical protein